MNTEICRREEGHNSYPLECRLSAGRLFRQKTLCTLSTFVLRLSLSWSFVETAIKANRIGPDNRGWSALVIGKCTNNCTRGRSRKEAELLVYCFRRRRIWGSKLHAGYSILLRFISNGALIGDDVKKFVSGLIIMGI